MFQIDRSQNRLRRLEQRRFGDLNLREREHLQEWLAHQPDALGEELLILQKEFDGFADTRERLDLLALDKDGQLVVIENKLDDSGRDVTWQALKYTAYVSSLTKAQIIDIFQQYLDRHAGGGNAARLICEFLDVEELDEVVLNPGHSQRLTFIAANFRKEVTATVLWLREHKIDARCFKVNLFSMAEELLFDIQPVIPTPEAADFMIQMAEKESEEKSAKGAQRQSHALRQGYWAIALETMRTAGVSLYENISPSNDHWLSAGSGLSGCPYRLIFLKKEIRVEFAFSRPIGEENKWLFDELAKRKEKIETAFGEELTWLRLDGQKESRIYFANPSDGYDQEQWGSFAEWHAEHMRRLEAAVKGPLSDIARAFKARPETA